MVDSDVVIINRPHGCLLVASAEFGLHVTHVTLFFPSWTEGRFERTLHIWGCSLDTTFNTLNYWDHVISFGSIHVNPKTNPSSKKLISCGVQCNLQTQEQMFSRGCWNGLVEFQQRSYRSPCRAKSMGRAHVYCSVGTYLNYSRKKMKVVLFVFFLKTGVDELTKRSAPLEINKSREVSTLRQQFALSNRRGGSETFTPTWSLGQSKW